MGKNIGKNISKNLIDKYSQKLLDDAKTSATDPLITSSKKVIQKTEEATGERYTSPEERQKIMDNPRLIQ